MRPVSLLKHMSLRARDGEIGTIVDTLFEDRVWTVRYIVVDTGRWLPGRQVLISPFSVRSVDWGDEAVEVGITREQVKGSPGIDVHQPVSRRHEAELLDYYRQPYYWGGALAWGAVPIPEFTAAAPLAERVREPASDGSEDSHLRSVGAVQGYRIEAQDGEIGHVDDFFIAERSWALHYIVVNTRKWLPGRRVVVPTERARDISWRDRIIRVDLTRDAVRHSPDWSDAERFTPDEEARLHRHYGSAASDARARGRSS